MADVSGRHNNSETKKNHLPSADLLVSCLSHVCSLPGDGFCRCSWALYLAALAKLDCGAAPLMNWLQLHIFR